jgi:hypothetical protein
MKAISFAMRITVSGLNRATGSPALACNVLVNES